MQVGEVLEVFGMAFEMAKMTKVGPYDTDEFLLTIGDRLEASISLRAAHRLLQTASEAYVHFNVRVNSLHASPDVHGVLGQTFRTDGPHVMKAIEYKLLSALLHQPVQADGESGAGYLDGNVADYLTSSEMTNDCTFSQAIWKM